MSGTWSYNANNELLGFADVEYDYDDNGNLTQITVAGEVVWTYVYDDANRLIHVDDGTGTISADYYYDPFGRRLWKDVRGTRTSFFYSDEGLIGEYDTSGNEIKTYGYRPDSDWTTDPLFMKQDAEYYFYQNDHLGTPQKLIGVNGAVVWSAIYQAFGNAQVEMETVVNNLRFPGQFFDVETGLLYNYHRYYDPKTGRYVKTDPIGFDSEDMNVYRYVKNNPVNYSDVFGLVIECDCIDQYLHDHGVTGWKKEGEYTYKIGPELTYNTFDVTSEILGTMIRSVRTFTIKELQQEWLVEHVKARKEIVQSALIFSSRVRFGDVELNPEYWTEKRWVKYGKSEYDAIQDILHHSPSVYSMGCKWGAVAVMLSGIARVMGRDQFDEKMSPNLSRHLDWVTKEEVVFSENDWIPGDLGYITNDISPIDDPLVQYVGENIIYVGNNKWWGHGGGIMSLEAWKNTVSGWDPHPSVTVEKERIFPVWGLEY